MSIYGPMHPGEVLKEGYLEPCELTVTSASKMLNVSRKTLSELINGRCGVSVEMALRLAKACKTTPEFWLNMQRSFDLWISRNFDTADVTEFKAAN